MYIYIYSCSMCGCLMDGVYNLSKRNQDLIKPGNDHQPPTKVLPLKGNIFAAFVNSQGAKSFPQYFTGKKTLLHIVTFKKHDACVCVCVHSMLFMYIHVFFNFIQCSFTFIQFHPSIYYSHIYVYIYISIYIYMIIHINNINYNVNL